MKVDPLRLAAVLCSSSFLLLVTIPSIGMATPNNPPNEKAKSLPPTHGEKKVHARKSVGDSSAPVTIVEYVDYNCPYCAQFANVIFPRLKKKLIETGKVYFQIRHFPIKTDSFSSLAKANAVECAARFDSFRDYRKSVYKIHPRQGVRALLGLAKTYDFDSFIQFESCVKTGDRLETVRREKRLGEKQGIRAIPSFVINGRIYEGLLTVEEFRSIIARRDLIPEQAS